MEGAVLLAVEQVKNGAGHTGQAPEVSDAGLVNVDAADASETRLQVTHARAGPIEASGTAAETTEEVEVFDFFGDHRCAHEKSPRGAGNR